MGRLVYLLDNNILSEPSRPNPNQNVQASLINYRDQICTAAPVIHEMRYSLARMSDGKRKQALKFYFEQVTASLEVFAYDREAALWHAKERARLTAQGQTLAYIDGQIAAIAAINEFILVTRNVSDFEDFADLKIENWFEVVENDGLCW